MYQKYSGIWHVKITYRVSNAISAAKMITFFLNTLFLKNARNDKLNFNLPATAFARNGPEKH